MRKKWMITAELCALVMVAGIGCGAKEQDAQTVTVQQEPLENKEQEQENSASLGEETADAGQQAGDSKPEKGERESLSGNVRGIGEDSIVIVKTRLEKTEEGVDMAIAPAPENETAEDYVGVNFADEIILELHTVKNGGMNPEEDVTVREASVSDIRDDMAVDLEGYYDGDVFIAEKAVFYEFI